MGMPNKDTLMQGFQLGPWFVLPERGLLRQDGEDKHLEPLVMDVLVALAQCQGDVLSNDQLVDAAWGGRAVTDDVIVRSIAVLRKKLGDHARSPEYIENIPRRGYRLKMAISVAQRDDSPEVDVASDSASTPRFAYYRLLFAGFAAVVAIAFFAFFAPIDSPDDGGIQSLAVFPLECAAEDKIVCYSIVEELVSQLLQAQDANAIKVVRSRVPFPQDQTRQTLANDLKVDGFFVGSLTRVGEKIHISAEIQDQQNGFVFWTKTYEGRLNDVIDIRSVLAGDVVTKLIGENAKLLEADSRPGSPEALEVYAAGQYEFSIRSAASMRKAIKLFEKTTMLDPDFGPAYVRLAYGYMLLPEYTGESSILLYEKALLSADAAVKIDPGVAGPAQTVYGFVYHKRNQWTKATQAHLQAIRAHTVYPISHQLYSRLLASVGRLDAALLEARKAYETEPQQAVQISRLAITYLWLDDLDNASFYFNQTASHEEFKAPIHDLAYSLFHIRNGDYDKAAREATIGLEKYGIDASWVAPVFDGMSNADKRDEALDIVQQLAVGGRLSAAVEISLWVLLGDADRAMAVARRLKDFGEIFEAELMFIPQFSILRKHPEFPTLLDDIGLTEYWRDNGCAWQSDRVVCDVGNDLLAQSME
jgi:DNA-binding winged helix-turn-helix (wHTH) protein/TolB-like protein